MYVKRESTCRLCLKITKSECKNTDESMRLMFDILLLNLDLNMTRDPIVCEDCVEVAKKCLDFKYTCLNTERVILSFSVAMKTAKLDFRVISKEGVDEEAVVDENFNICRFCRTQLGRNHFVSLDILMNDPVFEVLSGYLPEMDLNTIKNAIICPTCRDDLENYFKFIRTCHDLREKRNMYSKYIQASIKVENTENVQPNGYCELLQVEELDIKDEGSIFVVNTNEKLLESTLHHNGARYSNEIDKVEETNSKLINEIAEQCSDIEDKQELCDIKQKRSSKNHGILFCKLCAFETNRQLALKIHMNIHRDTLKENQKGSVNKSTLSNKAVSKAKWYQCSLCIYKAKERYRLQRHMLVHKDVSEIEMYKCSLCSYEAKQKNQLKRHMLVHRDVSDIEMFKCSLCMREFKRKDALKKHMLIHKDVSEIKMFKCSLCTYEAKRKDYVKTHIMLIHMDVSEIEMFKCSVCTYESKEKSRFKKHMLIHKAVSEIDMFKCSVCTYESRYKSPLKRHMLIHKDVSEIEMFKCSVCTYESKEKRGLKKHMLIHKDVSEIEMFKCSLCTYEAKRKYALKTHMLIHKNVSEIEMFKCSLCTYEAKQKSKLKTHMLIHEDVSEIEMFKCSLCSYKAKRKYHLKRHMWTHKYVSETEIRKCSL